MINTQIEALQTTENQEYGEEQDSKVLREIRLINSGLMCCAQYTELVPGDRSGRLRHCPCCMANYKVREEDMELLE